MKTTFIITCFLMSVALIAQSDTNHLKPIFNVTDQGLALKGYDPVSYFMDKTPGEGKTDLEFKYQGVTYRFLSEKNRKLFVKNPNQYLPEYGGYCAFGLVAPGGKYGFKNGRYDVNPLSYKIINAKLYLFYHDSTYDAKLNWNKEPESDLIEKADKYWSELQTKLNKDKE